MTYYINNELLCLLIRGKKCTKKENTFNIEIK